MQVRGVHARRTNRFAVPRRRRADVDSATSPLSGLKDFASGPAVRAIGRLGVPNPSVGGASLPILKVLQNERFRPSIRAGLAGSSRSIGKRGGADNPYYEAARSSDRPILWGVLPQHEAHDRFESKLRPSSRAKYTGLRGATTVLVGLRVTLEWLDPRLAARSCLARP